MTFNLWTIWVGGYFLCDSAKKIRVRGTEDLDEVTEDLRQRP